MAKRKNSAALFEVIARGDSKGLKAPSWIDGGDSTAAADRPATSLKHPPGLDGAAAPAAPMESEPIVAVVDGRLRFSLSYVTCVAVGLGLIVLLAAAYKLGRGGRAKPADETTAAMPAMFGDAGDVRAYDFDQAQLAARGRMPAVGRRILVIESAVETMEHARAIQEYLWSEGLTPLVHEQDGRIAVLDTVDVSSMTAEGLQSYQQRLAELGDDPAWTLRERYGFDQTQTTSRDE